MSGEYSLYDGLDPTRLPDYKHGRASQSVKGTDVVLTDREVDDMPCDGCKTDCLGKGTCALLVLRFHKNPSVRAGHQDALSTDPTMTRPGDIFDATTRSRNGAKEYAA